MPLGGNFAVMMNIMTAIAVSSTLFLAFMVYRWNKASAATSSSDPAYAKVLDDVKEELQSLKEAGSEDDEELE